MSDPSAPGPAPPAPDADGKPPHLDESVRRLGAAGRASLDSALDAGQALRKLVVADLALARSALGRALAWTGVAIVFGASSWLLLMVAAITLLQAWGWSWLAASATCALLSLAVTALAGWRVARFFDHAGMYATRRQLQRLGIGGDDDEDGASASKPEPKPEPPSS